MIDPKYADLPGIAYDQPDIYETDNISESQPDQEYNQDDGDSVEKIYVNATDAFNKFKEKDVRAISSKTYENSGDHLHRNEDESPLQKYNRVKQEIQELINEVHKIKDNLKESEECKSLTDIIYQIENSGKELEVMNIDSLLGGSAVNVFSNRQEICFRELKSQIEIFKQKNNIGGYTTDKEKNVIVQNTPTGGALKYQMMYYPDKTKVQDNARLSHLEKRLGVLENVVGISFDNTAKCSQILKSQGIIKSIQKLMATACLLNSSQLDLLETKVSSLLHKMDNVIQKKSQTVHDSKYEKLIVELYELVKESENYSQILPQTIDRMLSLSGLHKKAAEFIKQLKEIEDLQQNISTSLTNNKTLLEGIQTNFSSNLEIITNDITSLNQRIKNHKK